MSTIDFSKYSDSDLLTSITRIDRVSFPDNYEAAVAEMNNRGLSRATFIPPADDLFLPQPWLRFWAKTIDWNIIILVYSIIYSLVSQKVESITFLSSILILIIFFLYESVSIHLMGTTLGKSVFGISVKTKEEQLPSIKSNLELLSMGVRTRIFCTHHVYNFLFSVKFFGHYKMG